MFQLNHPANADSILGLVMAPLFLSVGHMHKCLHFTNHPNPSSSANFSQLFGPGRCFFVVAWATSQGLKAITSPWVRRQNHSQVPQVLGQNCTWLTLSAKTLRVCFCFSTGSQVPSYHQPSQPLQLGKLFTGAFNCCMGNHPRLRHWSLLALREVWIFSDTKPSRRAHRRRNS